MKGRFNKIQQIIKSMGLVFGDIGTSPIYTFTVIFLVVEVTRSNVISILSLIIWTLILVVSVQYAWLAMRLSQRGEGGSIVLNQILQKFLKSSRAIAFYSFLTYLGVSLLIGDSVITPAISILSAVEGMHLIPGFENIGHKTILGITVLITLALFLVQKHGTEKLSKVFGPIMAVWFLALGVSGFFAVYSTPFVLNALNPLLGINFIMQNGFAGFFVLSEVILCATGAEALYADMGHLGRKPILQAWSIVFFALVLNYLGQGAFLLNNPDAKNILFSMILSQADYLYIPFLIVSIMATIIASQAMISGLFSVVYQGINTQIFPVFKVDYTSEKLVSQIYIGTVNWFLLGSVLLVVLLFQESSRLATAYGLAVTGTMTITAVMMNVIFYMNRKFWLMTLAMGLLFIDMCFLIATSSKFAEGAYVSLIVSAIPLILIILYTEGNKALYKSLKAVSREEFLPKYTHLYSTANKIRGTALFFVRKLEFVPAYVVQTMFVNHIIYEDNILININKTNEAYGISCGFSEVAKGLRLFKVDVGYMQIFDLQNVFAEAGIKEKSIFYGEEHIKTNNFFWNIFAKIKKLTPPFVSFHDLPCDKIHGVVTQTKIM